MSVGADTEPEALFRGSHEAAGRRDQFSGHIQTPAQQQPLRGQNKTQSKSLGDRPPTGGRSGSLCLQSSKRPGPLAVGRQGWVKLSRGEALRTQLGSGAKPPPKIRLGAFC